MEITPEDLAALIEAMFFINILTVVVGVFVYETLRSATLAIFKIVKNKQKVS